jgi:hypothetical protein
MKAVRPRLAQACASLQLHTTCCRYSEMSPSSIISGCDAHTHTPAAQATCARGSDGNRNERSVGAFALRRDEHGRVSSVSAVSRTH